MTEVAGQPEERITLSSFGETVNQIGRTIRASVVDKDDVGDEVPANPERFQLGNEGWQDRFLIVDRNNKSKPSVALFQV